MNQRPKERPGIFGRLFRHPFLLTCALFIIALIVYAFLPKPVLVDVDRVSRGHLQETVHEDGRTRIIHRYVVAAPLAGNLRRIDLRPGDPVTAGETLLAAIDPAHPVLLDESSRLEAEARIDAAEAALRRTEAGEERARTAVEFARSNLRRMEQLAERNVVPAQELEQAQERLRLAEAELRQAQADRQVGRFEVEQARAALLRLQPNREAITERHLEIRPPVDGVVLRVFQESAQPVATGQPLLELGNPAELEIEIDVLSPDAIRIRPGAAVFLEHWGGEEPLRARVRKVEPAAFTKVSALGVEEQRVWVIADLLDSFEARPALGDGFRVEARIVTWEADDVLRVPSGALFRADGQWAIFAVENGRARLHQVETGRTSGQQTQILRGLEENQAIILHPGDRIRDGVRVQER